jgi:hypothetical protein
MRLFFSSGGSVGATGEAVRGRPVAAPCAPSVGAGGGRRRAMGWAGRGACGGLGRLEGCDLVGKGGKLAGKRKRRLGRKAGWAESDGENSFPDKN